MIDFNNYFFLLIYEIFMKREAKRYLSDSDSEDVFENIVNDTHQIFIDAHKQFSEEYIKPSYRKKIGKRDPPPPLITESFLIYKSKNRRSVAKEIEELIDRMILRYVILDILYYPDEKFLILNEDFINCCNAVTSSIGKRFYDKVIKEYKLPFVTRDTILKAGFTENDIKHLIDSHLIFLGSKSQFIIATPEFDEIKLAIMTARRRLVDYLKRGPCKMSDLLIQESDESLVYSDYHIYSLEAMQIIKIEKQKNKTENTVRLIFNPYLK